ncbi:hypothetical protein SIL77_08530 [Exiguobacterium profundum]|uniref:hypothetical protein n=1 Tax=Exiguobacterium profundum TaxID=307643 RepID=UPI0029C5DA17|nr:hypothetical protein [Exiguobacterium profundum]MDX5981306.1 hypothetical protein [Exiguobacterium profundum]
MSVERLLHEYVARYEEAVSVDDVMERSTRLSLLLLEIEMVHESLGEAEGHWSSLMEEIRSRLGIET